MASTPKSNAEFWAAKFGRNRERDARVTDELKRAGWNLVVVWECELSRKSLLDDNISAISDRIRGISSG